MAAQRTWLGRRKEILQILEQSTTDELERSALETLFQVQKRTALIMMKEIGPIERNHQWFVRKKDLLAWTRAIDEAANIDDLRHQKTQEILGLVIEEDRAARTALSSQGRPPQSFPLVEEILCSSLQAMPPGVEIDPGRIIIEFPADDPLQALESLYALGKALANDWESFVRLQTSPPEVPLHPGASSQPTSPVLPW